MPKIMVWSLRKTSSTKGYYSMLEDECYNVCVPLINSKTL